ncbi:MAG: hypothetical protein HY698_02540, partial [Deltaproteobacteria bacterium]|nr:hypothetical protein [Deltaproteobacteria bacterium]
NPAKTNGTACNDGNACTRADTCQTGSCTGANPITCTASDQCHNAGTCDPANGTCSNPAKTNGTACNDGNACTRADTCQTGSCTGANPIACTASDQCHNAGTCDPATGTCSDPAKANGTACNDSNSCTRSDTCQSGSCTGTNPITCSASDQCHNPGTCDPASGACLNPPKPDGTACSDGDACTRADTCQAGTCSGSDRVTCSASDQCHEPGTCDPSTGTCSYPEKPNDAPCDDGNSCTRTDTCQAGRCTGNNPVVCAAADSCHDVGTCDPSTGTCSNPIKPNSTPCGTSSGCTQTDTCQAGKCEVGPPVTCPPPDQCHFAGTCDATTGRCSYLPKPDGSSCSDGNACTQADSCQQGKCVGEDQVVCLASDQCHVAGECDPASGACSNPIKPNTTSCNDGNPCTRTDTCQEGRCVGVNPMPCPALDQCHGDGTCNPATAKCAYPERPEGTPCDDRDACTITDTCVGGACLGSDRVICVPSDQCHDVGTCDPQSGTCSNPPKAESTACDDGDACTRGEHCEQGECMAGEPVFCAAGACHGEGECDPLTGRCTLPPANEGSACDDNDTCTSNDTCREGTCQGEGEPCVPDAAPPDATLDAGATDGGNLDARETGNDAGRVDGSNNTTEEGIHRGEPPVNYYGCRVSGTRPTRIPLLVVGMAVLMMSIRRRSRR